MNRIERLKVRKVFKAQWERVQANLATLTQELDAGDLAATNIIKARNNYQDSDKSDQSKLTFIKECLHGK
jgi:hypothetical protein